MRGAEDYDPATDGPLLDPSDPTGHREICKNMDEVDAMMEAAAIDPRLPKIIYLRKQGESLRAIGRQVDPRLQATQCNRILESVTPKLLRSCGLRIKPKDSPLG